MYVCTEVTIGLERTAYAVREDVGDIEVCASLLVGILESTVETTISTRDGTAEGKEKRLVYIYHNMQSFVYIHILY